MAPSPEYIFIGSVIITFLMFSLSRFQLPHYMNILFPFFSILLAQYLGSVQKARTWRLIRWVQYPVVVLLFLPGGGSGGDFPAYAASFIFLVLAGLVAVAAWAVVCEGTKGGERAGNEGTGLSGVFGCSFCRGGVAVRFPEFLFYPSLLQYQSGSEAAFYINDLPRCRSRGPLCG